MKNRLIVVFIFCFSFSNAQINFEKGYFISNSGIKTVCLIKNIDWKNNPTQFDYKLNLEDAQFKTGTIETVTEFGIENVNKYKRYKVKIEKSRNNADDLNDSKDPKWIEEVLFLRILIEGQATLLSYSDDSIYKYFIETNTQPIEQLIRIKYLSSEEIDKKSLIANPVKENNYFRQQLYINLKCDEINVSDLENVKYEKSSLKKIFEKYNSCGGLISSTKFKEKTKKDSILIKLTPSINLSSAKIVDPVPQNNVSTEINGTVFKFGVELEYILPFNNSAWSIFINPEYQKYKAEKTFITNNGSGSFATTVRNTVIVDYTSVGIPLGLRRYFFLKNKGNIFVSGYYLNNSLANTKITIINDKGTKILDSRVSSNYGFGIGGNFMKKFSVELRFNSNTKLLRDYPNWQANYSSLGLVLGYRIL